MWAVSGTSRYVVRNAGAVPFGHPNADASNTGEARARVSTACRTGAMVRRWPRRTVHDLTVRQQHLMQLRRRHAMHSTLQRERERAKRSINKTQNEKLRKYLEKKDEQGHAPKRWPRVPRESQQRVR